MKEYDANLISYNSASHYSYDIHGNVKELWQEHPDVTPASQRIKHLTYTYDLISGKVNTFSYQAGAKDAFYHKYSYDGDNRIKDVHTSRNNVIWERDAHYEYYDHGPLARVELGDDNVQGIDYAYTLQGWIKGVNSGQLKPEMDMGADGLGIPGNPYADFGRDIFSYSLNYFENDYIAIGEEDLPGQPAGPVLTAATNPFIKLDNGTALNPSPSNLMADAGNLYNGNITSMVTTLPIAANMNGNNLTGYQFEPLGFAYKYDQLNRIKQAEGFKNVDATNNEWNTDVSPTKNYKSTFDYDPNGNITHLTRTAESITDLYDDLTYDYLTATIGGQKRLLSNRLYNVKDEIINAAQEEDDIEDQQIFISDENTINTANNYSYDEIGNLIKDNYWLY